MWVILIVGAPIMIAALFVKETSKAQILLARSRKSGVIIPLHPDALAFLRHRLHIAFVRPIKMMFCEPLVGYLSLYNAFAFAMMFAFFGSFPYVFEGVYHFNPRSVGLTYLSIMFGLFFAVATFAIFERTLSAKAKVGANGSPAPEHCLYAAMFGSFLLPIGLFW